MINKNLFTTPYMEFSEKWLNNICEDNSPERIEEAKLLIMYFLTIVIR